ncbi:MAG: hypothetical protein A3F17_04955 [Gammaproteobacteria bacterium RIFCSPHIGHO2_12_FULL_41_15]|nr:MAG: hypothetical protein A3F17_04955 [Gammaproteobacteria bacterium RIFCSPHIGHO2_12_FULL_41_15]
MRDESITPREPMSGSKETTKLLSAPTPRSVSDSPTLWWLRVAVLLSTSNLAGFLAGYIFTARHPGQFPPKKELTVFNLCILGVAVLAMMISGVRTCGAIPVSRAARANAPYVAATVLLMMALGMFILGSFGGGLWVSIAQQRASKLDISMVGVTLLLGLAGCVLGGVSGLRCLLFPQKKYADPVISRAENGDMSHEVVVGAIMHPAIT